MTSDYFDFDHDDGETTTTARAIDWPPAHYESAAYTIEPESVRLETVTSRDDDRVRLTARVRGASAGTTEIENIEAIVRASDGAAIARAEAFLDRTISDDAEIHGDFDLGPGGLTNAATVAFRLQWKLCFRKLRVARFQFEPVFHDGDPRRTRLEVACEQDSVFPLGEIRSTVHCRASWTREIEMICEVMPLGAEAGRVAAELLFTAVDEAGRGVAKDDIYVDIDRRSAVPHIRFDGDDHRVSHIRGVVVTAKGECAGVSLLGPFAL